MLTTNYDAMIEYVYRAKSMPITKATTVDLSEVNYVLCGNKKSVLFKVHGDVDSRAHELVFTQKSYDEQYAKSEDLYKTLYTIVRTKQLFFIGCSITLDRTVNVVKEVWDETGQNLHLGIVSVEDSTDKKIRESLIDNRIRELSEFGVEAIIYPETHHNAVKLVFEKLLIDTKTP